MGVFKINVIPDTWPFCRALVNLDGFVGFIPLIALLVGKFYEKLIFAPVYWHNSLKPLIMVVYKASCKWRDAQRAMRNWQFIGYINTLGLLERNVRGRLFDSEGGGGAVKFCLDR